MKKVHSSLDSSKHELTEAPAGSPPLMLEGEELAGASSPSPLPLPAPAPQHLPHPQHPLHGPHGPDVRAPGQPPPTPGQRPPSPPFLGTSESPPERPERPRPQFAVRSDSTILLSTHDLADRDLAGRVFWIGIEVTPEEALFLQERAIDVEQEAASRMIMRLPKHKKSDES